MPYDLPTIEVDGPPNYSLRHEGLTIEETGHTPVSGTEFGIPDGAKKTKARYHIVSCESNRNIFDVTVLNDQGRDLGRVTIRIAPNDNSRLDHATSGGLGKLGIWQFASTGNPVLSGAEIRCVEHNTNTIVEPLETVRSQTPSIRFVGLDRLEFDTHPAFRFLDILANAAFSRFSFGMAKQIARNLLALETDNQAVDFSRCLMRMRARGMIELEINSLGHIVNVHGPRPCVYTLPVDGPEGVYAALGGAWPIELLSALHDKCSEHLRFGRFEYSGSANTSRFDVPAIALVSNSIDAIRASVRALNVEIAIVSEPAASIAKWAEGIDCFTKSLDGLTVGPRTEDIEVFVPNTGRFEAGQQLDKPYAQLYRYSHRITESRVHGVRYFRGRDQCEKHAHTPRNWGTWLALVSCCRFLREKGVGLSELMPLPYDSRDCSLWMPASLGLPATIERSLVLCSGQTPREYSLRRNDESETNVRHSTEQERCSVYDQFGFQQFFAPMFFKEYLPLDSGSRIWLKYLAVPRQVATMLAKHLSCQIIEAG